MGKWIVMLEVESHLKPTELAMMVNMFPGVVDCRVADSHRADTQVIDLAAVDAKVKWSVSNPPISPNLPERKV